MDTETANDFFRGFGVVFVVVGAVVGLTACYDSAENYLGAQQQEIEDAFRAEYDMRSSIQRMVELESVYAASSS